MGATMWDISVNEVFLEEGQLQVFRLRGRPGGGDEPFFAIVESADGSDTSLESRLLGSRHFEVAFAPWGQAFFGRVRAGSGLALHLHSRFSARIRVIIARLRKSVTDS